MSSVTSRAEQALLGALLTQPQPAPADLTTALSHLRAEDFGQRLHQHLFSAITYLARTEPDLRGEHLITAVAARVPLPGAEPERLRTLAASAPNTSHATSYARMIQAAAFRREVAVHADRIATAASAARTASSRAGARMNGNDTAAPSEQQQHQDLLAAALTRQAEVYAALAGTPDTLATASNPPQERPDRPAGQPEEPGTAVSEAGSDRAALEDQLLADLLANPDQAEILARFLPEDTFSTDQRREIYQTMLTLAIDGEPLDEVIVNWNLELQRAIRRLHTNPDPAQAEPPRLDTEAPDRPGEPDIVYLTRLAGTITVTSTAIETGRHLLADDLRTNLASSHANGAARPEGAGGLAGMPSMNPSSMSFPATQQTPHSAAMDPNLRPVDPVRACQPGPTMRGDR